MVQKSCKPVEVGRLSHLLTRFLYIPGGDRRMSETSTVCQRVSTASTKIPFILVWKPLFGAPTSEKSIPLGKDQWRSPLPLVLVYHGPGPLIHLLGVEPSIHLLSLRCTLFFTVEKIHACVQTWPRFEYSFRKKKWSNSPQMNMDIYLVLTVLYNYD